MFFTSSPSFLFCVAFALLFLPIHSRIHNFKLSGDRRPRITLSNFGYSVNGYIRANIVVSIKGGDQLKSTDHIGFTFDKASTYSDSKRIEQQEDFQDALHEKNSCVIWDPFPDLADYERTASDPAGDDVKRFYAQQKIVFDIEIPPGYGKDTPAIMKIRKTKELSSGLKITNRQNKTVIFDHDTNDELVAKYNLEWGNDTKTDMTDLEVEFTIQVLDKSQSALWLFDFHDCYNGEEDARALDIAINLVEKNDHSYLSAGYIMLPEAYFFLFMLFAGATVFWFSILNSNREFALKLHWLMGALVIVKSASLIAHAMDYFNISTTGNQHGWAVIFYVMYLIRGVLLFFTLALIATGWSFVKGVLSDNERRVFIIVIPLQVLANIAYIILESEEQASKDYATWQEIAIFVDLICCGAIMFPIVWSIRHLGMALQVDGKGAMALKKLRLFKRFYTLTIAYIYLTRVGGLLLEMALPFELKWLAYLIKELATFLYFVFTGYTFRPGAEGNPYLKLSQKEEGESLLTRSGVTENIRQRTRVIGSSDEDSSDEENVVDTVALIKAARQKGTSVV